MEQEHLDLQETDFGYSLKNILAPTQKEYIFALLGQVQSFMNRLRWKTFFILNPETAEEKETYGFRTQNRPPHIPQLDLLQSNLIKIISNIKFKKGGNNLQTKMRNDLSSVRQDPDKLLVAADKSQNLYKMSPTGYKELRKRNVEKEYRRGPDNLLETINSEDKMVAAELGIIDRQIYRVQEQEAFITVKDHKPNFLNNPQCRLINPTKSELGKVAKIILENIVKEVQSKSGLRLWKNTKSVIDWFNGIISFHFNLFPFAAYNSKLTSLI